MARQEMFDEGSGEVVRSITEATGTRVYICRWEDRFMESPQKGESFGWDEPDLRCIEVTRKPLGIQGTGVPARCRIQVRYSSKQPDVGQFPATTYEYAVEMLEVGKGRTWQGTSRVCNIPIAIPFVNVIMVRNFYVYSTDPPEYFSYYNKVNSGSIWGAGAETLLLEGADMEEQWAIDEHRWKVALKFRWRPFSHNIVWRMPDYERNFDGTVRYNQTTHLPVPVSGTAGTGDWDRLTPELYETADFSSLVVV